MEDIRYDGDMLYPISNIGFVNVVRHKNYTFPYRDGKERYSFIMVEEGQMRYHFLETGESLDVAQGEVIFVPKKYPYIATYLQDHTQIKILIFDIESQNIQHFQKPYILKHPSLAAIYKSIADQKMRNTLFLTSKIYEIMDIAESRRMNVPERFRKILPALDEIEIHYFDNQKISYYADMCYMSQSNFRKLFREYTGQSLVAYRNSLRIMEAEKLLASGEYTVQEAAAAAGFNNMSFYYAVLRKLRDDKRNG